MLLVLLLLLLLCFYWAPECCWALHNAPWCRLENWNTGDLSDCLAQRFLTPHPSSCLLITALAETSDVISWFTFSCRSLAISRGVPLAHHWCCCPQLPPWRVTRQHIFTACPTPPCQETPSWLFFWRRILGILCPANTKSRERKNLQMYRWMNVFFFFQFWTAGFIVDYFILGPVPFKALSLLSLLSFVFISEVSDQSGRWVSLISLFFFFFLYLQTQIRDLKNKTSSTVSQSFHDLIAL